MNPIDRAGNAARSVGNYIGNLAREIRDVPTAFGTNISLVKNNAIKTTKQNDPMSAAGENNVFKQIKEVGGALIGKSGDRSDQYSKEKGYVSGAAKSPVSPPKPSFGTPMPRDNSGVGKVAPVPMPKKIGTGKVPYAPMGKVAP
jgi:hypothetical protein